MTHFLSPNPAENNALRATWMDSDRTSAVWAVKVAESDDARFVEPGAIKWFLLQVKGAEEGSQRNDRLMKTTVIHRVNTSGGVAPASECMLTGDVGKTKFVPYTADYVFYKPAQPAPPPASAARWRRLFSLPSRPNCVLPRQFQTPVLYRYVRHPLYVGWFFTFWSTPTMTSATWFSALATQPRTARAALKCPLSQCAASM